MASKPAVPLHEDKTKRTADRARIPQWLHRYAGTATGSVFAFCRHQGVLEYAKAAVDLAKQCFKPSDLKISKEIDAETGEEWVSITVQIAEDLEAAGEAHKEYLSRWVSAVPWPERRLIRIAHDFS
jgi:hypothetical protein